MEGNKKILNIAVVGCLHGKLKDIYDELEEKEMRSNKKIDFLICCGDFQAIRNYDDLNYLSCPDKYKEIGQFQYFYKNKAPYLTFFIGGNHEASNLLNETFYGGWICENVFYLGRAGVINYKGLRIAGLSGIFKSFDYFKGHFEKNLIKDIKSIYHVREYEIAKLNLLSGNIDIFISHDWPIGVVDEKDHRNILKVKRHWKEELETNTLGSPASEFIMKFLKPKYWFSAHMHYGYMNTIKHDEYNQTRFIALDKILPNRKYLYYFEIETEYSNSEVCFDSEWLAITKSMNEYLPLENNLYNFSNFFLNKSEYLEFMNEEYLKIIKNTNLKIIPKDDFLDNMNKYKKDFKNDIIWKYSTNEEQKTFLLNLLDIYDIYTNKNKKSTIIRIKNTEEIDVDFL